MELPPSPRPGRALLEGDAAPLLALLERALLLLDNGDLDGNGVLESAFKTLVIGLLMHEVVDGTLQLTSEERVRKERGGDDSEGYVDLVVTDPSGERPPCLIELKYASLGYVRDVEPRTYRKEDRKWEALRQLRDRLGKETEDELLRNHRVQRKDDKGVLRAFADARDVPYASGPAGTHVFPAHLVVEQAEDQVEHYESLHHRGPTWKLVLVGIGARVVVRWQRRVVLDHGRRAGDGDDEKKKAKLDDKEE